MDRQQVYLQETASRRPDLAEDLTTLGELYHKKLWHELSVKLEELINTPRLQEDGVLIALYQNFIASFAPHINLLKLAVFAVAASKQIKNPDEGVAFLQDVITGLENLKLAAAVQPILYLKMHVAQYDQAAGRWEEANKALEAGEKQLQGLQEVDPSVSAAVHYVAMSHHKAQQQYGDFYKAALLYLAHVRQETLPADTRLALAVDVSLAALLGKTVYSFGELLLHPIVEVLQNSAFAWLYELLVAFNNGDIHGYDSLCVTHAAKLNAQPALVQHERQLREKITILSLTEMVSSLPAEDRTLTLEAIGQRTKLPLDGVEFLLMKALSLHLLEGVIDQVAGTVQVSWVQPRVLTMDQVQRLKGRLDAWVGQVAGVQLSLQEAAVGLVPATVGA
ncbi:RPN9 [Auxenochlorella protothecoides x Auxenochlorella symbiontica]|uniref:26S proteasome non-ATPase regulatory subunit 13 n=1 Tax=Auxenochlorella protothecoides TaxID=3075 RepID=A0A087SSF9_AUXPR|nr:26S proteasome non-ATPase regulatory subunit 13 [Auxenochlorella protothecoides]KFM28663.1 26S proteasome non-ATPase regulatory subunit 13 [Auxenochlorella protothecoides]